MKSKMGRLTRILLFATVTFGLYAYLQVDGEVPIHFDRNGDVDDSAPKYVFLLIPFGITLLYVFLQNLSRDPKLATNEKKFSLNRKVVDLLNLGLVLSTMSFLWFIYNQIK